MKVLVADDSCLYRRVLADALSGMPGVQVVGHAANGKIAIQRIRELKPDVVTLDIEMPEVDGMAVLDALRNDREAPKVIVVSALTKQGAKLTIQALQKGAFDFITKPDTANVELSREALRAALTPRLKALALRLDVRGMMRGAASPASPAQAAPAPIPAGAPGAAPGTGRVVASKPDMVLIGVSTGGPNALAALLPDLPAQLSVPVLIVQHMPPLFTQSLAETLDAKCSLRVREAAQGNIATAGTIYIAPGGHHMRLAPGPDCAKVIQITDDPPENNCRPAVDYLFRSVALNFPGKAMGVILTGMGSDGTLGLRLLRRHGCFSIAQDEASCVVYGMPRAAVEAGVVDVVLPLDAIAARIAAAVRGGTP